MPYITTSDLEKQPGAQEIAQVATPDEKATVVTELMRLTLTAGDRSAYSAADIAVADRALATVNAAIADVEQLIDGFLALRYTLPLATVPAIVKTWARALVRYALHRNLIATDESHPIVRDRRDALKLLEMTSTGKFSLGVNDPVQSAPSGDVRFEGPERQFTTDTLKDF